MPRAELVLALPEGVPLGDLSRAHPEARFRVLAAVADGGSVVGLAEVIAADSRSVVEGLASHRGVADLDVLGCGEDTCLVEFEVMEPGPLSAARESGVPAELPFDVDEGEARWEVTAPTDDLADLVEQLDSAGIGVSVQRVRPGRDVDRVLTDRQRRLVRAAVERGYYDTPRGCTLTDLADELGIAKSTASELLHRAEEKLVKGFLERSPDESRE